MLLASSGIGPVSLALVSVEGGVQGLAVISHQKRCARTDRSWVSNPARDFRVSSKSFFFKT